MAKKAKTDQPTRGDDASSIVPASGGPDLEKKEQSAGAKKKPAARKRATTAKKSGAPARPAPSQAREPSDEEIRLRAYFIAERRIQLSLPGDSDHDWLEAKRQLMSEGTARAAS